MIDPTALPDTTGLPDATTTYQGQDVQARKPGFSFPAPRPSPSQPPVDFSQLMQGAGQGKGGLNLNSIMPLLLLAAPLIEAHNPGAGMAMASNYLNYTRQQADQKQRAILGLAHEFANVPDEQEGVVRSLVAAQLGVKPNDPIVDAVWHGRIAWSDPNLETERTIQRILGPQFAAARSMGIRLQPGMVTPDQARQLQAAGVNIFDVQGGAPAVPAQPGGGELGTRTPPVPAQPAIPGQVVYRGETQDTIRPGATWGQVFAGLVNNPQASGIVNQPIPREFWDPKTGTFKYKEAQDQIDRLYGTPYEQAGRAATASDTARRQYIDSVRGNIGRIVSAADSILNKASYPTPQDASNAQRQAHDLLQRGRDYITREIIGGRLSSEEGNAILSTLPTSFMPSVARPPKVSVNVAAQGRIPENIRTAITALQNQINITPEGPARDALTKRLQGIYDQYDIPAGAAPTRAGARSFDPARNIADARAKFEGVWNEARMYPKPVTDAMQRIAHGQGTSADQTLVNNAAQVGSTKAAALLGGIMNYQAQIDSFQKGAKPQNGAQPASPVKPATPPTGAQQQTFTKGGFPVYMVNGRYWSNGRFLDPKTGEPIP